MYIVSLLMSQLINDRFYYFTLYYNVFMLCSMLRCLQPAPQGSRLRSGSTRPSGAAAALRRRAREAHRGAVRSVRRRRGSAPPCNSGADCRSQAPPRWQRKKTSNDSNDSNIEPLSKLKVGKCISSMRVMTDRRKMQHCNATHQSHLN